MEAKEGRLSIDHHLFKCLMHLWHWKIKLRASLLVATDTSSSKVNRPATIYSLFLSCFMYFTYVYKFWQLMLVLFEFFKSKTQTLCVMPHIITASDYFC